MLHNGGIATTDGSLFKWKHINSMFSNSAYMHGNWRQMTHRFYSEGPPSTLRLHKPICENSMKHADYLLTWNTYSRVPLKVCINDTSALYARLLLCRACFQRTHTHLFDTAGILLHGNFLHGALKAKEGLDVQAGRLLKTRPVLIFRVDLHTHAHIVYYTVVDSQACGDRVTTATTHPVSLDDDAHRRARFTLRAVSVWMCQPFFSTWAI